MYETIQRNMFNGVTGQTAGLGRSALNLTQTANAEEARDTMPSISSRATMMKFNDGHVGLGSGV
jgi:hypothetical protein